MVYYFIKEEGKESGPYTIKQLECKSLNKDTLVWHAGIKEWCSAYNIYELKNLLEKKLSLSSFAKSKLKKILGIQMIKASLKKVS